MASLGALMELSPAEMTVALVNLMDVGAIEYFQPSISEDKHWVVGLRGRVLRMDVEQARCFLAGTTAVAEFIAGRCGLVAVRRELPEPGGPDDE